MPAKLLGRNSENDRIVLGLLQSVERDSAQTQRHLAGELGIAVGLVNLYLKRCVTKGLLKIADAPARRYAYYLTPTGFSEKARLTLEYLSYSFDLFRRAKADCASVFLAAAERRFGSIALAGVSDLAEVAIMCALEKGIEIVGIVDPGSTLASFAGATVVDAYDALPRQFNAVVITELKTAQETYADAVKRFGSERVLLPSLLGVQANNAQESAA